MSRKNTKFIFQSDAQFNAQTEEIFEVGVSEETSKSDLSPNSVGAPSEASTKATVSYIYVEEPIMFDGLFYSQEELESFYSKS